MILTTRLKLWALACHACIVVGLGHGIITLAIAEFYWLSTFFLENDYVGGDGHVLRSTLQLVGLMCLFGQIATIISIIFRHTTSARWVCILGVSLLWVSVFTYAHGIRSDNYAHLSALSCLPFLYCTLRIMLGGNLQRLREYVYDRI